MDALTDIWHSPPQEVTAQNHRPNPKPAADNVEHQISRVGHVRSARHWWAKRSDDRYEPRKNHRAPAVLLIKIARSLQVAAAEKERLFSSVQSRPPLPSYPESTLIPQNHTAHHRPQHNPPRRATAHPPAHSPSDAAPPPRHSGFGSCGSFPDGLAPRTKTFCFLTKARRAPVAPASIASSARSKSSHANDCTSGRS